MKVVSRVEKIRERFEMEAVSELRVQTALAQTCSVIHYPFPVRFHVSQTNIQAGVIRIQV